VIMNAELTVRCGRTSLLFPSLHEPIPSPKIPNPNPNPTRVEVTSY
jgi:hypothetical protein